MRRIKQICFLSLLSALATAAQQATIIKYDNAHWSMGAKTVNLPQTGPEGFNYKSPVNYFNNTRWYWRYECTERPNNSNAIYVQYCFWNPGEACTDGFQNTKPGVYYHRDNKGPSHVWTKGDVKGLTVKFNTHKMVHKKGSAGGGWIGCGNSWCASGTSNSDWVPVKFNIHIMVGPEDGFVCPEDWTDCPWGDPATDVEHKFIPLKDVRYSEKLAARYSASSNSIYIVSGGKDIEIRSARIVSPKGETVQQLTAPGSKNVLRLNANRLQPAGRIYCLWVKHANGEAAMKISIER
jgi:hypothetical protein